MSRAVLALGISQIVSYGSLYYAFPLLVPSVAASFDLAETTLFAVFSAGLLAGGLLAPAAGRLMDRHGAPWLMTGGSLAIIAVLACIALAPSAPVYALGIVAIEILSVTVLYDAAFATLVTLEGPMVRRAITRLTLIAGFASTIFWPLTGWLTEAIGWRGTYAVFAALQLGLALPLHLWLTRQRPAAVPAPDPVLPAAPQSGAPLPPALARPAYLVVAVSFALSAALISAFGVHMVPVLTAAGLGAAAPLVAMVVGPAQVTIRLIDALFWKALHPLSVAAISALALPVAVTGLLLGAPLWLAAPAFAALFGIGQGLASIVRGSVPHALFGPEGYGARLGHLALIRTLAAAGAPFAFAALLAQAGLPVALGAFLALGLVAALPLVVLRARLAASGRLGTLR